NDANGPDDDLVGLCRHAGRAGRGDGIEAHVGVGADLVARVERVDPRELSGADGLGQAPGRQADGDRLAGGERVDAVGGEDERPYAADGTDDVGVLDVGVAGTVRYLGRARGLVHGQLDDDAMAGR